MANKNAAQTAQPVHRRPRWLGPVLFLALLTVILYSPVLTGSTNFWEDLIHQEFPNRMFSRDCLLSGQFPHWNPFTFGGMPFFAALQAGVFYPFNLLLSILPAGPQTFWYLLQAVIVSHIFFAGLCMFALLRWKGHTPGASVFGATGYMLCGFLVTHLIHALMLYMLAWLPLVIMLMERGMRERRADRSVLAGVILGLSMFAGHPQLAFYEGLFIAAWALYVAADTRDFRPRCLGQPLITAAVALGFAAFLYLPGVELSGQSARVAWTYEMASEGSVSLRQLAMFIMPKVFGAWTGQKDVPQFWVRDTFNDGYHTYWETCFYTGIAILVFALAQFRGRPRSPLLIFTAVWGAFSLAMALGSHFFVYRLLFDFVPGFGSFRMPGRILFTWNFLLPVLAARTFDGLAAPADREKTYRVVLIGLAVCLAAGLLSGVGALKAFWIELEDPKKASYAALQGWLLVLAVLLVAVPVLLRWKNRMTDAAMQRCVIGALALDLLVFGWGQHMTSPDGAAKHFAENRRIALDLQAASKAEVFRVSMRQFLPEEGTQLGKQTGLMLLKRNQGMIDRVQMIEGYNPLNLLRRLPPANGPEQLDMLFDLMNVKYFINPSYRGQGDQLVLVNPDRLPRAAMFYRAKVLTGDSLVQQYMTSGSFDYRNELVLTEQPAVPLPEPDGPIACRVSVPPSSYRNNRMRIDVETEKSGLLFVSEIWYPAWKAFVDDRPAKVLRADYSFRAVEVPAGTHRVEMRFQSAYFTLGAWIFAVTVLSCGGFLGWNLLVVRKGRQRKSAAS